MADQEGLLILIGGHEDKDGDQLILTRVAEEAKNGSLLIVTAATDSSDEAVKKYVRVFEKLGVQQLEPVEIQSRQDAEDEAFVEKLKDAAVVFFTGGDQLLITSRIGDTPFYQGLCDFLARGGVVAGTSAGTAVIPDTMLIGGDRDETPTVSQIAMAPGLGLLHGVVTDSHFAERGRIGRLLGVVAQNPKNLGMGIDENTAVVIRKYRELEVIGEGGVYILDGSDISHSTLSEGEVGAISVYDIRLHLLAEGSRFDLETRTPLA